MTPDQTLPGGYRAAPTDSHASYVDWPAILAGAVFAVAVSLILFGFGGAVGLSMSSPYGGEGASATWLAIAAGLWFLWVTVSSFGAGGYLAGRMRRRAGDAAASEVDTRDGAHGLMVWATGALVGMVLAAGGVGGVIGGAVGTGGAAVSKAAEAVGGAEDAGYYADLLLRGAAASPQEGASGAAAPAIAPAADPSADAAAMAEIAAILRRGVVTGEVAERDRAHLASLVAARTGLGQTEARARVDGALGELDEARATALAAVEKARIAGVVFGFVVAATLLVAAAAAYFTATLGGRHRDEGLGFDGLRAAPAPARP